MKITIKSKQEILDLLQDAALGIGKDTSFSSGFIQALEQNSFFLLDAGRVTCFSDKSFASVFIPQFESFPEIKLPYASFLGLLNKIQDNKPFSVEVVDNSSLLFKQGLLEASIQLSTVTEENRFSLNCSSIEWEKVDSEFCKGIKLCEFSTLRDSIKPLYAAICITDGCIITSDNYKLSRYKLQEHSPNTNFSIHSSVIEVVVTFNPSLFGEVSEGWIAFQNERGAILCIRKMDASFPDTISTFFEFTGLQFPVSDLIGSLVETVSIFSSGLSDLDSSILITIKDGILRMRSDKEGVGWISDGIPIEYTEGPEISFYVNPTFFTQILSEVTHFQVDDDLKKIRFFSGSFEHICFLLNK